MRSQEIKELHKLEGDELLLNGHDICHDTLELKRTVLVKQYAPETFRFIRSTHNINDDDFFASLDPSQNLAQIQSAGQGAGASGSFFFFTADHKYLMKTMSYTEILHMLRSLSAYMEYID